MELKNKYTLRELLEVLKYHPESKPDLWSLYGVFQDVDIDYCELSPSLFDETNPFTEKVIYDNQHQSDELSSRTMLYFNNEPLLIYGRTGDNNDTILHYIDADGANKIHNYGRTIMLENEDDTPSRSILEMDAELDISDQYTKLFLDTDNKDLYSSLNSPRYSYGYSKYSDNIKQIVFDGEGNIQDLKDCKFIEYKIKGMLYGDDRERPDAKLAFFTVKEDEKEKTIEYPYNHTLIKT